MCTLPIAISLSPNCQKKDAWRAFFLLLQPWRWQNGEMITQIEQWFKHNYPTQEAVSFNSGRSALYAILKSFAIGEGDEVLIQAFTCVAVPNSIIWSGAKPVYADIDNTFNLDTKAIEKYISSKTKAIIIQHTFGIPAQIEKLKQIAEKYGLILIEDCAHSLDITYGNKKLGTFADASFFSFGRDKVISSVFGGMAIINSKFKIQNSKLREFQKKSLFPNHFWIFQQLMHPIAFSIILPVYNFFSLGKIILRLLQFLHLLSFPVYQEEKIGRQPNIFPAKLPNALAVLAFIQLERLSEFNKRRKEIAEFYIKHLKNLPFCLSTRQKLAYLRYPILAKQASQLKEFAKSKRIILGDWYSNIIDPKDVSLDKLGYIKGSCPNAERIASQIINLPTYQRMTIEDARRIVKIIHEFYRSK